MEVPSIRIGFGAKSFAILGGETAVMESLADPPGPVFVPPSLAEMKPLTLRCGPAVVTVTVTANTQFAPTARAPSDSEIVLVAAVVVSVPPHSEVDPSATVTPVGKVSEKAISLKVTVELGLVIVKLKLEVPPTATGSGENDLLMVGGLGTPQPVKETLSMFRSAPLLGVFAPKPESLKKVVPVVLVSPVKSNAP